MDWQLPVFGQGKGLVRSMARSAALSQAWLPLERKRRTSSTLPRRSSLTSKTACGLPRMCWVKVVLARMAELTRAA
ncbi:MAG: hypothetical protein Q4D91_11245 [Lautropia sp.]|nr:hypothetical protein [Lautropia sp.]